jgi:SAM-dependent methyltransferase
MDRVELLLSHANLSGVGLEVGPLARPMVKKADGYKIFYADYASQEVLVKQSLDDVHVDCTAIPHIDYVVPSPADYAKIDQKFDYILASHVIEHTPDFIGWIKCLLGLLTPDGRLILAIPDRRYMFDYFRPESTVGDALEAYFEKRSRPSFRQVMDGHSGARQVSILELWDGVIPEEPEPYIGINQAFLLAKSSIEGSYSDCHCWVFTIQSFKHIITTACDLGVLNCRIISEIHPVKNSNEFHFVIGS